MFNDALKDQVACLQEDLNKLRKLVGQIEIVLLMSKLADYKDPDYFQDLIPKHDLDLLTQKLGIEFKEEPAKKLYIKK